jgi:D-alanine-D-alanine ligase
MGGRSGEHAVSLRSGAAVLGALEALGWQGLGFVLTGDGRARWPHEGGKDGALREGSIAEGLCWLERASIDCAFIAMHGEEGEDGRVQGALELLRIPYQGSGIQASAIGLDKARTKDVLKLAELPLAADRLLVAGPAGLARDTLVETARELGLPLALKTMASGSSVGVALVRTLDELLMTAPTMVGPGESLLVEAYVAGREFTLPVLETLDGTPEALPVVEIRPRTAAFFDYEAKYTPGATDELCPAPIPPDLEARLRALGVRAHTALGCAGYSRTDCIVAADGSVVLLEVNTLPGLTNESLLPKAAQAAGLSFPALVERLVLRAIARHGPSPR